MVDVCIGKTKENMNKHNKEDDNYCFPLFAVVQGFSIDKLLYVSVPLQEFHFFLVWNTIGTGIAHGKKHLYIFAIHVVCLKFTFVILSYYF